MNDSNAMQTVDPMVMAETLASDGFPVARTYFATPSDSGKADHARDVLKALGIYSRIRATRANEAAITVAVAKMMGLQGAALSPLWEQLTGRQATPFLPTLSERSNSEVITA